MSTSALWRLLESPVFWATVSSGLVVGDYYSGDLIQFPIAFVIPVLFMAWHLRRGWAIGFALVLPFLRLLLVLIWKGTVIPPGFAVVNLAIRISVLMALAVFVLRFRAAEAELRVLRGILPVCMHCKKIRDEGQNWQQLESYISAHSEAVFSHGLCPSCAIKMYPKVFPVRPPVPKP